MAAQRYPLSWPTGWGRTRGSQRQRANFSTQKRTDVRLSDNTIRTRTERQAVTVSAALGRLLKELRLLNVREDAVLISTNIPTRNDGLPYSSAREPEDPGAAVYFKLKGADRVLACDRWTRLGDNLTAIAQHIDAIRRIDRYGVGTLEQAFAGYVGLPAKGSTWRTTLGFKADANVNADAINAAFRERARTAHPDVGGSHDAMASLTAAKTEGLAELSS